MPWPTELRALYAIGYPGSSLGSKDTGDRGGYYDRTREEGCIVVAGSDECVRFHEIWAGGSKSMNLSRGLLGGSEILEGLDGMDTTGGDLIR